MLCLSFVFAISSTTRAEDLYESEIKPLLKTKCWACHGPLKQESNLRLDSGELIRKGGDSEPAAIPGDAKQSLLIQRISSDDEYERMPPEGEPLTAKQVKLLRRWINDGMKSPENEEPQRDPREHWAYQPLHKKAGEATAKNTHPIDFYIQRKLAAAGLEMVPRADPRSLLRRLFFDMHGLPPSLEQTKNFVNAPTADAFNAQIENLLNSPRYGERWGQHWLDVVRYADTHGFEVNTPRENSWPYRDYVIDAFNSDKPYDQFVREQIAGDHFNADAGTGFLVAAAVLLPGQIGKDEPSKRLARQDSLDEMIVGTSATFLGLTLGCARCHDHKFDPLTQADYYAMQAFFAGVDYGDREIKDEDYKRRQKEAGALTPQIAALKKELLKHELLAETSETIIIDDEDLERVTVLKEKNGHGQNPKGTGRGQLNDSGSTSWMPNFGRGRYTWWDNHPGEDVMTYNLGVEGEYQVWISWGVHGSGVHTRDARYVLDVDGDLKTTADQTEMAQVDQYYMEGQTTGETEKTPLWSSLRNVGIHRLIKQSKLILRGGETGTGITADVIVLQAAKENEPNLQQLPSFRAPVKFAKNVERFASITAKRIRFTSFETTKDDRYEPCIDELEVFTSDETSENIALASNGTVATSSGNYSETGRHQLKHINDGQYGNERSWISNENGKGWVQLEFPESVLINRVVWGRDRNGKFQDRLPVRYQIEVGDEQGEWTTVATSQDRLPINTPFDETTARVRNSPDSQGSEATKIADKLASLEKKQSKLRESKMVYAGQFREPDTTHVLMRGDPEQPGESIAPRVPKVFGGVELSVEAKEPQRRLALADWLTSPDNPLTARVMVNRIWKNHFGTGLVATPSDFGVNGSAPSHPELLDWLASEFIEHNWSVKHIHRLILTSQTWQQSNRIDPVAQKLDADCRLLWRFPSRRLEAEAIRDSLLFVSGQLNYKMGGPGFDFFKTRGGLSGFPPVTEFNENGLRRMIYAHKIRMESVPVFGAFDCPDAGQAAPSRSQSTTAIQALNLFNSSFVAEQAFLLADKIKNVESTSTEQVRSAYLQTLGREPSEIELNAATTVVEAHGLPTLTRVLLNCNEFLMLP